MMKKWMSLLIALMLLLTMAVAAVAEEESAWTEEELAAMDAALNDDNSLIELQDTFRIHVEDGDWSVTEDLDKDIMNILLLGTDSAGMLNTGRTDAMIICSINMRTGETKLSSIVRDLYVDIPYMKLKNRINTANSFGGPNMAIKCVNEALGIFGAAQRFAKAGQAEAVVDALAQNAAQVRFALQNQQIAHALFVQGYGGCKARRAAANDDYFSVLHAPSSSRTLPVNSHASLRAWRSCAASRPSSSSSILAMRIWQ